MKTTSSDFLFGQELNYSLSLNNFLESKKLLNKPKPANKKIEAG
jgi:hypothetical protein